MRFVIKQAYIKKLKGLGSKVSSLCYSHLVFVKKTDKLTKNT